MQGATALINADELAQWRGEAVHGNEDAAAHHQGAAFLQRSMSRLRAQCVATCMY
ncbi:MAG: hypothetical protein R3F41_16920 [Gammaproteobacteria bacterium]